MRHIFRFILVLVLLEFSFRWSAAQCTGGTSGGALSPVPAAAFQTMAVTTGNYYTFVVPPTAGCSGPIYTFSFCAADGASAGFDSQITILDNTGAYAGAYSDDFCGLQSYVTWTAPAAGGTFRVLVNTYFCGSGSGAVLAYRVLMPVTDPDLSLLVNATSGPGVACATLTSNTTSQRGCAWDLDNTLNFLAGFTYDFTVNLGSVPGGADGMCFVIQNDPLGRCACGTLGGALGAAGISNSLLIEIDTYLNAEDRDDGMPTVICAGGPEPDHLDIWLNGNLNPAGASCPGSPGARIIPAAVELLNGGAAYDVENGLNHIFRISWTPGSPGTLTARLMNLAASTTYGMVSYNFTPLSLFGTNTPFFGFTGSTGGLSNTHTVCFPNTVLPVSVIPLEGNENYGTAELRWNFGDHHQNGKFIVSRKDAGSDWKAVGEVYITSGAADWTWTDFAPASGENQYRIHWTDGNTAVVSDPLIVFISESFAFKIWPVPATDELNVFFGEEGNHLITVFDAKGSVVAVQSAEGNKHVISLSSLPQGFYWLKADAHPARVFMKD